MRKKLAYVQTGDDLTQKLGKSELPILLCICLDYIKQFMFLQDSCTTSKHPSIHPPVAVKKHS